jgi:hypothetical protein
VRLPMRHGWHDNHASGISNVMPVKRFGMRRRAQWLHLNKRGRSEET